MLTPRPMAKLIKYAQALFCHHSFEAVLDLSMRPGNHDIKAKCFKCTETLPVRVTTYQSSMPEPPIDCGKKSYKSRKDALTMLNLRRNANTDHRPTRVYSCPQCHSWHLTSQK